MSVFTHGVTTKGKPRLINHNQVFTVVSRRKMLRRSLSVAMAGSYLAGTGVKRQSVLEATYRSGWMRKWARLGQTSRPGARNDLDDKVSRVCSGM